MTAIEIPTPDPRTLDDVARPFAEAIASQYAIKKLIGRGGMGIVYLARDKRLDRLVAIKTLPPELAADPAVRERFLRETRTAGRMSHPNIVPIFGADEVDGHVFFVMGYVEGESLFTRVRAQKRIEPADAARYLRDVAAALAHAHRRGIVHRDIKAENILIDRATNRALVTDFGIARLAEAAPLTATGQLLGTVYYVSPEQVSGEPVDARSDVYSLGIVGFFALSGQFPFDAELASAVLVAHVTRPTPPLASIAPHVHPALCAIIDKCLAKTPAQRFATADDLVEALDAAIHEIDAPAAPPLSAPRSPLISDTEAHAVWQRAAELQSLTGSHTRPDAVPRSRDRAKDAVRTSGYRVDDVRIAAREAGIPTAYIDHALIEHGLAPQKPQRAIERKSVAPRKSWLAGVPLDIVEQAEIEGTLSPARFDELINVLRDGTARLGESEMKNRSLVWRCAWLGHRLRVSVEPANGRMNVTMRESIRRMVLGTTGATLLAFGGVGAGLGLLLNQVMQLPSLLPGFELNRGDIETWATVIGVAIGLGAFPVSRAIVRWLREQNAAHLHTLAELLSSKIRDGVTDDEGERSKA